jgi:hypothetical protein
MGVVIAFCLFLFVPIFLIARCTHRSVVNRLLCAIFSASPFLMFYLARGKIAAVEAARHSHEWFNSVVLFLEMLATISWFILPWLMYLYCRSKPASA